MFFMGILTHVIQDVYGDFWYQVASTKLFCLVENCNSTVPSDKAEHIKRKKIKKRYGIGKEHFKIFGELITYQSNKGENEENE